MEIFLAQLVPVVMVAAVGFVSNLFRGWVKIEKGKEKSRTYQEALAALEIAVLDVQEGVVDDIKEKAADGKLTREEIDRVRRMAIERALAVASKPAATMIGKMAEDALVTIINSIVRKQKKS
jgi:hypothetical protein